MKNIRLSVLTIAVMATMTEAGLAATHGSVWIDGEKDLGVGTDTRTAFGTSNTGKIEFKGDHPLYVGHSSSESITVLGAGDFVYREYR